MEQPSMGKEGGLKTKEEKRAKAPNLPIEFLSHFIDQESQKHSNKNGKDPCCYGKKVYISTV